MIPLLLSSLLACGKPDVDPCSEMCANATQVYTECIDDWGITWEDAGYANAEDFRGTCDTWAWEVRLLEADAVKRGDLDAPGVVDDTCRTRATALGGTDAQCDTYTSIDWSDLPWSG